MVLEDELEIVALRSCSPAKLKPQRKLSVSFAVNVKQNSEEKRTMANSPESKPTRQTSFSQVLPQKVSEIEDEEPITFGAKEINSLT